jgi:cell wall-associated NlpC family hydrolase
MRLRVCATLTLILLFAVLPRNWPHFYASRSLLPGQPSLSKEIDTEVRFIAALSTRRTAAHMPDARLFGALVRLEEMLPRSAATRFLQNQGKKVYLEVLRTHSPAAARRWAAARVAIERQMARDAAYQQAMNAIDRRLDTGLTVAPPTVQAISSGPRTLPFDKMRPGDIMLWDDRSGPPLVRFGVSLFAKRCTHTAIYLGETRSAQGTLQRWTYEALNPKLGVRVSLMDRKWTRSGLHVSLGHVRGISPALGAQIARKAVQTYGADGRTPYHLWPPWDKTYYGEGLYCSQLVWTIYHPYGIDLDSNDWRYLVWFTIHNWYDPYAAPTAYFAVFPDEIKASPSVSWYYDQANP